MLLERIQIQLECLYGIGLPQRVKDFIISKKQAQSYLTTYPKAKIPKELFFVRKPEDNDTVEVALFLDKKLIKNLEDNNPLERLTKDNLSDFCIMIEGISHFVYYLWKAANKRDITQLELELQAEIDKFLMLFFYLRPDNDKEYASYIMETLFEDFRILDHLPTEEKDRYLTASQLASRFCQKIREQFSVNSNVQDLLSEVRTFYNFSQQQKIQYIMP